MILRGLAVLSGIALVSAAAYASLAHAGEDFTSPYGVLTLAVAGGLIVGALCFGAAWGARRVAIALLIGAGMLCGEIYALILTGERVVSTREAAQVSVQEAVERRQAAMRRVLQAEAALAAANSSTRLDRALAARAYLDRAVVEKSAERGCASNCRELLQAQIDTAQREVDAAHVEKDAARRRADAAVGAARAELASIRLPPNASPLAARLRLPAWAVDLAAAGLASLAINGLGAALLAFGAHGGGRHDECVPAGVRAHGAATEEPAATMKAISSPSDGPAHLAKFAVEKMRPDPDAATPARDIRAAYLKWCQDRGHHSLSAREMADCLAALCKKAGSRWAPKMAVRSSTASNCSARSAGGAPAPTRERRSRKQNDCLMTACQNGDE